MDFFEREIRDLYLVTTLKCNLNCRYCYVQKKEETMSLGTAKKAVDIFLRAKGSEKKIIFFGGEPLLEPELLKKTISYAKEKSKELGKRMDFMIETNGTLLTDEILAFLDRENARLCISFDGKTQDKNREFAGGKPSSSIVMENIEKAMKYPNLTKRLQAIITTAGEGLFETVRGLHKKGMNRFRINIVYEWLDSGNAKLLSSGMRRVKEYSRKNPDVKINEDDGAGSKSKFVCGISDRIMVRCDGTIIPCEGFINSRNSLHLLGDLKTGKMNQRFFYDGKEDEQHQFCFYFDEKDGRPMGSEELKELLKRNKAARESLR